MHMLTSPACFKFICNLILNLISISNYSVFNIYNQTLLSTYIKDKIAIKKESLRLVRIKGRDHVSEGTSGFALFVPPCRKLKKAKKKK